MYPFRVEVYRCGKSGWPNDWQLSDWSRLTAGWCPSVPAATAHPATGGGGFSTPCWVLVQVARHCREYGCSSRLCLDGICRAGYGQGRAQQADQPPVLVVRTTCCPVLSVRKEAV